MTDLDLALRFFLQLAVILCTCRAVGWVGQRFLGQTQVVSEMLAGVMLGPSLFGLLLPDAQTWLFPVTATVETAAGSAEIRHPSMSILYVASQLGLVLYMFLVGLELDVKLLKERGRGALAVSLAGILAPFVLGGLLAFPLLGTGRAFEEGVSVWAGALFMGAAMCITAFPMLARIIYECGIAKTSMGTLALSAAAFNDASAWCMLAVVLSAVKGSAAIAVLAIGGGAAFVVLLLAVRPLLGGLSAWTDREGGVTMPILVTTFALLLLGAWTTDVIGIYAIFGAFAVGVAMPRGRFAEQVQEKCGDLTTGLLLPMFFVYSGLNTKVTLLNDPVLWLLTGAVVLVAILGKGLGCAIAARLSGERWRESLMIGTLMNARGLIELIILNIGLQQGVITPTLYTMMVIMAIVTTVMASPIFNWMYWGSALPKARPAPEAVP